MYYTKALNKWGPKVELCSSTQNTDNVEESFTNIQRKRGSIYWSYCC
jgi:hypothetical protein